MELNKEHSPTIEQVLLTHYGWSETTMSDDFMQEFRKKYRLELAAMQEYTSIETEQLRQENERLTEQLVKVQHDYAEDTRAFGRDAQAREERIKELEAKP